LLYIEEITQERQQERETAREYIDRESHYVWGKRYLLKVVEGESPAPIGMDLASYAY
jgi:hypothetical protein